MKSKKLEAQIQALRENLRKAETRLEAAKAADEKSAAARVQAAIDGKTIGPRDRRETDEAADLVATLTEALARAESALAVAVRAEEADALRAEMKALGGKLAASGTSALDTIGRALEELSVHVAQSGRLEWVRDRLIRLEEPYENPESCGYRAEQLVENAIGRTWGGRAKTRGSRVDVVLQLHPGDFPA